MAAMQDQRFTDYRDKHESGLALIVRDAFAAIAG